MWIHLPHEWGNEMPACGKAGPNDMTITDPRAAEAVTCPRCAALVIGLTLSDRPKAGC